MKIILTCCLALLSVPVFAQGMPAGPYITVSGQGRVQVVPDVLDIHLSVEKRDKSIEAAQRDVDRHTAQAVEVARRFGIAKADITSTRVSISPQYDYQSKPPRLLGYDVRREVSLTLRDIGKYDQLLSALVKAGVNRISGVSARYSKPATLRDEAFARAVADARAKAGKLAQAFGAALGKVYAVTEQSAPSPRPLRVSKASFAAKTPSPTEPGTIDVEATIQVTFRLKP
ncbi:MAG TPA: SIMPL domain-containing protein [Gammaproteobacteria bacterium]|nr:SIMPL domain-containing protein [Gammaproteobacteria bacterium]